VALLSLLCMAQFVNVFDINVVIIALPVIGRSLGFSQGDLQWVVSAYVLAFAGFLLLAGRMADLFGRRRLFLAGLGLFGAASLVCGLAPNAAVLLVGRALQGLGAATTAPAALSIITTTFKGDDRNRALGAWTAVAAGGGAAGLVLGGVITDGLGWQWVFLINVPLGIGSLLLSLRLVPKDAHEGPSGRVDVFGAIFGTAGLTLLIYGLTRVESEGLGVLVTASVFVAGALLAAFLVTEARVPSPLVPLRLFRSRHLVCANLVAFTLTATTSPTSVLAVIYVQTVLGFSPTQAGFVQLPFSVLVIVGSVTGSRLTNRYGTRPSMALGLLVVAGALVVVTRISSEAGASYVVAGAALAGLGLGWASVASTATGTSAAPGDDQGLASGLLNVSAQVGTAMGLALFVTAAALRTQASAASGDLALVDGYRFAFFSAACVAVLAMCAPLTLLRDDNAQRSRTREAS
jgi:EmrB/QacA subfamily drug resistance transporter